MLPDRVSNPGPLTYEPGALPIALRGPAYDLCVDGMLNQSSLTSLYAKPITIMAAPITTKLILYRGQCHFIGDSALPCPL